MGTKVFDILTEGEKKAVKVLVEAGWEFFSEVSVEKATPPGERWPLYTSGGTFAAGVLRKTSQKKPSGSPKKSQTGKK